MKNLEIAPNRANTRTCDVFVRLTPAQKVALQHLAAENGISVSELARRQLLPLLTSGAELVLKTAKRIDWND